MPTLMPYYLVPKTHYSERSRIAHIPLLPGASDADIATLVSNYESLSEGTADSPAKIFSVTEAVYNTRATQDVLEDSDLETANPVGINALIVNVDNTTGDRRTNPVQLKGLHPTPVPTIPFAATDPAAIYQNFLTVFSRVVYRGTGGQLEFLPTEEAIINKTFKMH